MRIATSRIGILVRTLGIVALGLTAMACSVPNLETPQCAAARYEVKRFYSLHFANEAGPAEDYRKVRDEFLTDALISAIPSSGEEQEDYFTKTADFPKAFRVGGCTSESDEKADFQVILLWRDDTRNEQTEVVVRTVRNGEEWLIDSVEN